MCVCVCVCVCVCARVRMRDCAHMLFRTPATFLVSGGNKFKDTGQQEQQQVEHDEPGVVAAPLAWLGGRQHDA